MSSSPETVRERLRYRYEWALYRLGGRVPLRFVRSQSYLRFHLYLARREIIVPTEEGAKWRVYQADGHIRYVAAYLYARDYDCAERIGDNTPREKYHITTGGIVA